MYKSLFMKFIAGPLAGKTFGLEKLESSLGSGKYCDIQLMSESITSEYIRFYTGSDAVTIIVNSSGYKSFVNNELIELPYEVSAGDVLFFPDGSILYFDDNSENINIQNDAERKCLSISDSKTQRFFIVPSFSPEFFCFMGFEALKEKDYLLAYTYFQEAKKYNPNYSQIYRGLLFIELRISSEEEIEEWDDDLDVSQNYTKFIELSYPSEKALLLNRIQTIIWNKKKAKYDKACEIMAIAKEPEDFKKAAEIFDKISDFLNAQLLSEKCWQETVSRAEQKKQWISNIKREEMRQKRRSSFSSFFIVVSVLFLIICGILFIKLDKKNKELGFVEYILNADISNRDDIIRTVQQKYDESPDKYYALLKKAFTQAYYENNYDQMNLVTDICLHTDSVSKDFSDYLAFEYRDFAVDYLTNQLQEIVDSYGNGTPKTVATFPIIDNYALISEVSLKKTMELINEGLFEKALALLDFLDERYDMSPIINSTVSPLIIAKNATYTFGLFNVEVKSDSYLFKNMLNGKSINLRCKGSDVKPEQQFLSVNNNSYSTTRTSTTSTSRSNNTSTSRSSNKSSTSNKNNNSTTNPYGYGDPKPGESFSDYVKREDPQLWRDIEDNWAELTGTNPYGYGDPKPGESVSDYIKREDPQLWSDMEDRWDYLFGN